jgi:hypothetical protein
MTFPNPTLDLDATRAHLDVIPRVCRGGPEAGELGALPQRSRFHWLVSPRSTIIQMSPVHTGRTDDPGETLAAAARDDGAVRTSRHDRPAVKNACHRKIIHGLHRFRRLSQQADRFRAHVDQRMTSGGAAELRDETARREYEPDRACGSHSRRARLT